MKAVRSSRFPIPDRPPHSSLPRKRQKLCGYLFALRLMDGTRRRACLARRFLRLCCGKERRARARVIDWRQDPGPPMRSAWERQCAGPLCLPARALSSASGGGRWGRCGSRRTGFTTAIAVSCRYGFATAAITGTCTALEIAPASAVASPSGAPRRGISAALGVRCGMLIASVGGGRDNDKNQK